MLYSVASEQLIQDCREQLTESGYQFDEIEFFAETEREKIYSVGLCVLTPAGNMGKHLRTVIVALDDFMEHGENGKMVYDLREQRNLRNLFYEVREEGGENVFINHLVLVAEDDNPWSEGLKVFAEILELDNDAVKKYVCSPGTVLHCIGNPFRDASESDEETKAGKTRFLPIQQRPYDADPLPVVDAMHRLNFQDTDRLFEDVFNAPMASCIKMHASHLVRRILGCNFKLIWKDGEHYPLMDRDGFSIPLQSESFTLQMMARYCVFLAFCAETCQKGEVVEVDPFLERLDGARFYSTLMMAMDFSAATGIGICLRATSDKCAGLAKKFFKELSNHAPYKAGY